MTNLIVLSYLLVTNPVQQAIIGQTNGQAIVVNMEHVEAVTEVGFKSKNGVVSVGESRKVQSVKTWTNLARMAVPPTVSAAPAPATPDTNTMSRGQQREFERTNAAKAKP